MNRPLLAPALLAASLLLACAPADAQDQAPPGSADEGPILVTGSAIPVARTKIGSALTVIERERIERREGASLHDILREVPGLAVSQAGSFGGLAQVRIRGAEGNHTLVLVDGIEVSAVGTSEFDFSSLLAANVERVEVLRGPQSGLYGSNALAGVINVITRGGDGPLLDAAGEAGSFGTVLARGALTLGRRESFLTASSAVRFTNGFSSARNGSEDDGDRTVTAYLRGAHRLSRIVRIEGSLRFVDKDSATDGFDFSGGPLQGLAVDDESYSDTRQVSGGLAVTLTPTRNIEAVLSGSYSDYELVGGFDDLAGFGDIGDRLKLGGRLTLSFDTGQALGHGLTVFVDSERETYRNTFPVDPTQVSAQSRDLLGVGAEYRLDLWDRVFLKAALRHDDNSRFADATTYSLTGAWAIAGTATRLHASYGKGVANPTFTEQFGFIPGQFVGNRALRPETAEGFDLGVEQRLGPAVLLDLTYFESRLEDEIVGRFPTVVNEAGTSERRGVEVSARADLGWLDVSGAYTWLKANDVDGTREVLRPEHQASLSASARFGPGERGRLDLGAFYNGGMFDTDYRDYFNNGFVAGKALLDAHLVARLAGSYRLTEMLELFGRVENLFDARYEEALGYATPGLSAYGGLRVIIP
jgi:vitamin B12 transporter